MLKPLVIARLPSGIVAGLLFACLSVGGPGCRNKSCYYEMCFQGTCLCLCDPDGRCPSGGCYGGLCVQDYECPCYDPLGHCDQLEPNNLPEMAIDLPCSDPASPYYTPCSCPPIPASGRRRQYQNGLQGLEICPAGDLDYFRYYLFAGDTLFVRLIYRGDLGRSLDLVVFRTDENTGAHIAAGSAWQVDNDKYLEFTASAEGFYYILLRGVRMFDEYDDQGRLIGPADINEYIMQFALNPEGCNFNGRCDPYETARSCETDCPEPFCSNLICEPDENGCPEDCFCGNGTCDEQAGEDNATCLRDCPVCS